MRISGCRLLASAAAAALAWLPACSAGSDPGAPRAEPRTLAVLVRAPYTGRASSRFPVADGARLYAGVDGISAFDAASGERRWTTPGVKYAPENVVVSGGRVFVAEAAVRALDAATGRELWRHPLPDSADASLGQTTVHDGVVYAGTRRHHLLALDAETGALRWDVDVGPDWEYLGQVKGVSVSGDTLYAGAVQWRAQNGYKTTGWVMALDRATGRVLWRTPSGTGRERRNVAGPPTVAGGLLLASDEFGNSFYALDRLTGREVWRYTGAADRYGPSQSPQVVDGVGYVASNDMAVYAFDPATGSIRWRTPLRASASEFTVCGDVVFANHQGLAMLDRRTGRLVAERYGDGGEFLASGFAVSADGTRAFAVGNRYLYAFACA